MKYCNNKGVIAPSGCLSIGMFEQKLTFKTHHKYVKNLRQRNEFLY